MHIAGVDVAFLDGCTPFPQQLAVMGCVIRSIQSSQNALIESPTGTGKTLSLLSSALSWQRHQFVCDGGTVSEGDLKRHCGDRADDEASQPRTTSVVRIFYASRTHTQLEQVIAELQRCPEVTKGGPDGRGLKMTILGSRDQFCVNPKVSKMKHADKSEACNTLVKDGGCFHHARAAVLAQEISKRVMDVEEVVAQGAAKHACPYYAAKISVAGADLILLPYTYLLNPSVHAASGLNEMLDGSVVIFDEAHNVEDVCREAASVSFGLETAKELCSNLAILKVSNPHLESACEGLVELVDGITTWLSAQPHVKMDIVGSSKPPHVLTGGEARTSWSKEGVLLETCTLEVYRRQFEMVTCKEVGEDPAPGEKSKRLPHGLAAQLEMLLYCLEFMLSNGGAFVDDFRVAAVSRARGTLFYAEGAQAETALCIWCMNPAVAFSALATKVRSVILTSGTLSPLSSFAAELGVEFPNKLELAHVCDVKKRLLAVAVQGMDHTELRCTYAHSGQASFIRAVGESVLLVASKTPGGVLVFFTSYTTLDGCVNLWMKDGLWNQLQQHKVVEVEGRGGGERFDASIESYRAACASGRGGLFLCVFRGKLSEGVDFRDEQARAVVVVGIPFPNTRDVVVALKKQYQDAVHKRVREDTTIGPLPLTGEQWYSQQAFRALNQAIGRVIRHKEDFGAIVLLDTRFTESQAVDALSKWVQGSVKSLRDMRASAPQLVEFFKSWGGT